MALPIPPAFLPSLSTVLPTSQPSPSLSTTPRTKPWISPHLQTLNMALPTSPSLPIALPTSQPPQSLPTTPRTYTRPSLHLHTLTTALPTSQPSPIPPHNPYNPPTAFPSPSHPKHGFPHPLHLPPMALTSTTKPSLPPPPPSYISSPPPHLCAGMRCVPRPFPTRKCTSLNTSLLNRKANRSCTVGLVACQLYTGSLCSPPPGPPAGAAPTPGPPPPPPPPPTAGLLAPH